MIFILLIIISILVYSVQTSSDYCYLPCKNPFTSSLMENSACQCEISQICGTRSSIISTTAAERAYIVHRHNVYRHKVASGNETRGSNAGASNMAALVYDAHMERVAQCHANKCLASHDECRRTKEFNVVGQNFFMSYAGTSCRSKKIFKNAIKKWYSEVEETSSHCISHYSGCAGHFTQVVWAETTNVGCGRMSFDSTCHVFCNYGPAGNVWGQPVYKFGKPNCTTSDRYPSLCKVGRTIMANGHTALTKVRIYFWTWTYVLCSLVLIISKIVIN